MHSMDPEFLQQQSAPLMMLAGNLRHLGRYQGKQELLLRQRPQLLETLKEIAIVQSTESSNRIEGIEVPHDRLKAILQEKTQPKNRPEGQVLGYRNVLAQVHTNYHNIEISPQQIIKMHKEMFSFTDLPGGEWKHRDNLIEELCDGFRRAWNEQQFDRLLLALAFVFDFLCIHPFTDGNGRISRLLTVLLLHQLDFDVLRFVSFEKLVEDTKESYYETLKTCSERWHEKHHSLLPWFEYHLSLLLAAYKKLEERVAVVDEAKNSRGTKTALVLEALEQLPEEFSIGDLIGLCPGVSRPMIRHVMESLRKKGKLLSTGVGRAAMWRKIKP